MMKSFSFCDGPRRAKYPLGGHRCSLPSKIMSNIPTTPVAETTPQSAAVKRAQELAHDASRKAQEVVHDSGRKVEELTHDAGRKAREIAHDIGRKAQELVHDVSHSAKGVAKDVRRRLDS
jgi:hypothetical protein